ncbi:c-type cytochrome biogenesis protein CcmI [Salinispirillum marinum]|uniref:C-type cytochrome biogenesis protein CcmI n=2 Tax=Saccharospirillaceae TaxID=255527 RepID=A0ABV8BHQ2_9GAMM
MTLWIMLLVLTALAALFIAYPAVYGAQRDIILARNSDRLAAYDARRAEIAEEQAMGALDEQQAAILLAELDKNLLAETGTAEATLRARGRLHWPWAVVATLLVSVAALSLYQRLGAQETLALYEKAQVRGESEADFMAFMSAYEDYVLGKANPTTEDWFLLADAYTQAGRFPEAIQAYDRVEANYRAQGEYDPLDLSMILTARGQLHFFLAGQTWTEALERDFREAIRLDPENVRAMGTLGIAYFADGEYQKAIDIWTVFAELTPEGSERDIVLAGIQAAQEQLGGEANIPILASTTQRVEVVFTPLPAGISADAVVFVLARPVGERMPVAVQRHRVGELPSRLILTDRDRMNDDARLSDYDTVEVTAFISPGGTANAAQATHEAPMLQVNTEGDDAAVMLSFSPIAR